MKRIPIIKPTSAGAEVSRSGKVFVLLAIAFPMLIGVLGLVVDGSLMMSERRYLQQIADAAATAGAREIGLGHSAAQARTAGERVVSVDNGLSDASVTITIPPATGPYAGNSSYVQAHVSRTVRTFFMQAVQPVAAHDVSATAVAGIEPATAGGAIMCLDPTPSAITVTGLPIGVLTLPQVQFGALEVLGLGQLRVQGAVMVNSEWGGVDENGDDVGESTGLLNLTHAVSCTPILPLSKLVASDIRVTGGVDNPNNYGSVSSGDPSPLRANRMPVPDPFSSLPAPTITSDPTNVNATLRGSADILSLPFIGSTTLNPGVYEWIQVTAGVVKFNPGVYIIRSQNPLTGISLNILAGQVTANGVMFYITDSSGYSAVSGTPDSNDGEMVPPEINQGTVLPTVVINMAVLGSSLSPLNSSSSPFDGMMIYQRRTIRRPIVLVAEHLLSQGSFAGTIYAKWGQVIFAGHGTYDARFVVGNARIVNLLQCTIAPSDLLPPARDVFLVQ